MGKIATGKFIVSLFLHIIIAILGGTVYLVLGYLFGIPELVRVILIVLGVSYAVSGWNLEKTILDRLWH